MRLWGSAQCREGADSCSDLAANLDSVKRGKLSEPRQMEAVNTHVTELSQQHLTIPSSLSVS